jgi:hypothetical protein
MLDPGTQIQVEMRPAIADHSIGLTMVQLIIGPQATTMFIRNIGRILDELFTGRGPKTIITGTTLITRIQLIQIPLAWRHRGLGNIDGRITRWQKRHGAT